MDTTKTARVLAVIVGLALGGCGSDDAPNTTPVTEVSNNPPPSALGDKRVPFTPANDVEFIDFFVGHHRAAIEMAQMVVAKGERADVGEMAQRMIAAQTAELEKMRAARSALTGTAESQPLPPDQHMMADMEHMKTMSGSMLDEMFLAEMIGHHAAGIAPAKRAIPNLARDDMRTLARSIAANQAKEVGEMNEMRTTRPEEPKAGGEVSLDGDRRVPLTPGSDVVFIDFFVPHHMMAVQMAQMVVERGRSERVRAIARNIVDNQTREIATMKEARLALTGSDAISMPTDAQMEADMQRMMAASAEALDAMFITEMIPHHAAGLSPAMRATPYLARDDMRKMSNDIFEAQAKEIGELSSIAKTEGISELQPTTP